MKALRPYPRITITPKGEAALTGVLQTKVNSRNEKSPAKFARLKEGITKQAGEKTHRQPE